MAGDLDKCGAIRSTHGIHTQRAVLYFMLEAIKYWQWEQPGNEASW